MVSHPVRPYSLIAARLRSKDIPGALKAIDALEKKQPDSPVAHTLRGRLANGCIALLTLCAFLIGTTIILLFLGETTDFQSSRLAVGGFLAGVACFLLALVCFLTETLLATRLLDFHMLQQEVEVKRP